MSLQDPTPNVTKLIIYSICKESYSPLQADYLARQLRANLTTLPLLHNAEKYTFKYEMPEVRVWTSTEDYLTKPNWFSKGGKTKTRIKGSLVYLEFSRILPEEELNFWRAFKLGYLCHYYRPTVEPSEPTIEEKMVDSN